MNCSFKKRYCLVGRPFPSWRRGSISSMRPEVQELLQDPVAAAAGDVQKLGQEGSGDHGIIVHLEQAHDPQKIALIDAVFLGVGEALVLE